MNKKDYLASLLTWAEEVEEKVNNLKTGKEQLIEWYNQLEEWKGFVQNLLDMKDEDISDQSLKDVQAQSKQLIDLLTDLLNKPRNEKNQIAPGKHSLPPLPYAYDALEPYISSDIMRLHHQKHHQSYVDGLNKAEQKIYASNLSDDLVKHWMREQAFNGSGHYLHTIFWNNMSPQGGGKPSGSLLKQIDQDFGSFNKFKSLFSKAAKSVEGVGWAILVWQPRSGRLAIQTVEKHQMFSLWDTIPLLVLDVWEHAYYLQYKNNKAEYVDNWWNVVNWKNVQSRLEDSKHLRWTYY
ncbi:superoxide dismutase [Aquibacillus sediminis]|uniref:superoxide dismutase n=1 Tax=Aquibacillus sediminis TaxID=2574734 RepID=UPI001109F342|nr:superoxide dismutase [Aquibacillus sediminis]